MRPCGACRAYVPADTGCRHWKPGRTPKAVASAAERVRRRKLADDARHRVADFTRLMGRNYLP